MIFPRLRHQSEYLHAHDKFYLQSKARLTRTGVGAFASLSETFEYALDGIDFMSDKPEAKVKSG
jgi:hypothetical protein